VAIRLLQHPRQTNESITLAETFLYDFVENFTEHFGEKNLTYNVHNLLHIADCVRQFG
jgi:hypothetical protein